MLTESPVVSKTDKYEVHTRVREGVVKFYSRVIRYGEITRGNLLFTLRRDAVGKHVAQLIAEAMLEEGRRG